MTCCSGNTLEITGADPQIIKWTAIRGDTASIRIEFWNPDEVTPFDTSTWQYLATAYDSRNDSSYELDVIINSGYVDIVASPDITELWGASVSGSTVAELSFDLQVTIDSIVWTPVLGTIVVLSDVTRGVL